MWFGHDTNRHPSGSLAEVHDTSLQMFEMLSRQAEQSEFLHTLAEAQKNARQNAPVRQHGNEVLQENWWHVPPQAHCTCASEEEAEGGLAMRSSDDVTEV